MNPHDIAPLILSLVGSGGFIGLIGFALWSRHERKITEIRLKYQNQGDASLRATVEALQQEVRALRETTMQYDLSFDTALQRIESRVEGVERRVQPDETDSAANLRAGR